MDKKDAEEIMKINKILIFLVFATLIISLGGLTLSYKTLNLLQDNINFTAQQYIIDTGDKIDSNIDPKNLKNNVELSLEYCKSDDIVHYGGNDVTDDCVQIKEYSDLYFS